jgi:hypothetical protein
MVMKKLVGVLFSPFVFSLGFLAPLIAELLNLAEISVFGIETIYIGLLVGGLLGLVAQRRGSWIWVKP